MSSQPPSATPSLSLDDGAARLRQWLYRPIVFREPERLVPPASWVEHIPFAFWLIDAARPRIFVELGTHSGNSYAAFAQAIEAVGLATAAYAVDTWQGDPQAGFYDESVFQEWSTYHDRRFSTFSRLIRSTFDEAADHFADGSVDLLHIDGWHTYEAVCADYQRWRPKMSSRGVIVFHDINVRERDFGAWRAWEEFRRRHRSFAFLHGHGLGVLGIGHELPEAVEWLLSRTDETEIAEIRQFFATIGRRHTWLLTKADQPSSPPAQGPAEATIRELEDAWNEAERRAADAARRVEVLEGELDSASGRLSQVSRQLDESQLQLTELQRQLRRLSARLTVGGGRARTAGTVTAPASGAAGATVRTLARRLRQAVRFPQALGLLPSPQQRLTPSSWMLLRQPALLRDAWTVHTSGLFDADYYRACNPDVAGGRMAALVHFLLKGAAEDRDPHPLFDTSFYLSANPDVGAATVNPLAHYVRTGAAERRQPHPLFDTSFYFETNPQVREEGREPLGHFLANGAGDGRRPNPYFDCRYYLAHSPDVASSGINPLVHYAVAGWREGRRPSADFDPSYYAGQVPDVRRNGTEPLAHYLTIGRFEGRAPIDPSEADDDPAAPRLESPSVVMRTQPLGPSRPEPPTIVCLTHVVPLSPRAGNEYRINRMLRHFKARGYRIVPIVAPLPGEPVGAGAVHALAEAFGNAVVCHRDGRVEYLLTDVPDVLSSLDDQLTAPYGEILGEGLGAPHLLAVERTFCHDLVVAVTLRLHQALASYVLLCEYIWMSRVLPLVDGPVVKVIDTHDVFSTKSEKVMRYGITDLEVTPEEEAARLARADLVVAIQPEEARELQRLAASCTVVTAAVDVDLIDEGTAAAGHQLLYVASNNAINRKAVEDFLRFAWPDIRQAVPDAELLVVGRIGEAVVAAPEGVTCLGLVDDLRPLYAAARLVINPAIGGTGLKIKTLEAIGHLRPVVCWPSGVDGMPPQLRAFCVIVRDWYDFARQTVRLLEQPLAAVAAAERDELQRLVSPDAVYAPLEQALQRAASARRPAPLPSSP